MKELFVQQDSTFLLVQWVLKKKKENWTSIGNKIVNKFNIKQIYIQQKPFHFNWQKNSKQKNYCFICNYSL